MNTPEGMMRDTQGRFVPVDLVKPQHLLENTMVCHFIASARKLSEKLAVLKAQVLDDTGAFRELLAGEYNVTRGGKKGNISFKSYDGAFVLEVSVQDSIDLGPELEVAKTLIDACVARWSEGANQNLKVMVEDAFQVGKSGRIDTQRILSLRRLDIEEDDWRTAMDAIADAIRVHTTRTYVRFYEVDPDTGARKSILLDFAKV